MIKALFFDIDGTLVSFETHNVPQSTVEALKEAKRRGVKIFIATGRPKVIINNLGEIPDLLDGYITMNGAYCFVGDEVIYKSALPREDVLRLTAYCAEQEATCIVIGEHDICAFGGGSIVNELFHEHLKVEAPIPDVPYEEAIDKEVFQLTPFISEEQEKEIGKQLTECEIARWHPAFTDVTRIGNTKQRGIDEVISRFGIKPEETMAFGDGGNDMTMLQHAGIGVAMGNALEHVKAVADYVTTGVDEDGVMRALKHFGVI